MKVKTIDLNPFPTKLFVMVDKKLEDEGICGLMDNGNIVIKYRKTDDDTILHEVVHAVDMLQKRICGNFDIESRAYWTTWLYKEVKQAIKKSV